VPALSDAVRATLRTLLPPFAAVGNPVDLTPQVEPALITSAIGAVMADPDIAGAVAVDVGLDIPAFAEAIVAAVRATGKPAVAFAADAPEVTAILVAGGVPVLPSPERAVRAWRALWQARTPDALPPVLGASLPDDVRASFPQAHGALAYADARRLLQAAGVRFCRERAAATIDEAVAAAEALGYPVVVKADAPGLMHKTEAAGVVLDVADADGVRAAWQRLTARTGASRVLIQERVGPGVELLLGARRDEVFGPVIVLGTGGILTETMQDVSVRLAPITDEEIEAMMEEGARPRLLAGPRGLPAVDRAALATLVRRVADLIASEPRVGEIDINPVIAAGADLVAVDALVTIEP
jgi:acyl-CoA synthetase (NDP forming)